MATTDSLVVWFFAGVGLVAIAMATWYMLIILVIAVRWACLMLWDWIRR